MSDERGDRKVATLQCVAALLFLVDEALLVWLMIRHGLESLVPVAVLLLGVDVTLLAVLLYGGQKDGKAHFADALRLFFSRKKCLWILVVLLLGVSPVLAYGVAVAQPDLQLQGETFADGRRIAGVTIRVIGRDEWCVSDAGGRFKCSIPDDGRDIINLEGTLDGRMGHVKVSRGEWLGIVLPLERILDVTGDASSGELAEGLSRFYGPERAASSSGMNLVEGRIYFDQGPAAGVEFALLEHRMLAVRLRGIEAVYGFRPWLSADRRRITWLPLELAPGNAVQLNAPNAPSPIDFGDSVAFAAGAQEIRITVNSTRTGEFAFLSAPPGPQPDPEHASSVYGENVREMCCLEFHEFTICANSVKAGDRNFCSMVKG